MPRKKLGADREDLSKFVIRIQTKTHNKWQHFCYVQRSIRSRFDRKVNKRGWTNNDWMTKWAWDEFEIKNIEKPEMIELLKKSIHAKMRRVYPEIYLEFPGEADPQGWCRVWVAQNMMKELGDRWPSKEMI